MDYQSIIDKYYTSENPPLRELLIKHSRQVADFAKQIIEQRGLADRVDSDFVEAASMLHDIGVRWTHAPGIFCYGTEPYLRHGLIGAEILRRESSDFEAYARVCERHIGVGLTANEIVEQKLPLPAVDFIPETLEEQIVCYADNFFSKSHIAPAISLDVLRSQMERYGEGSMQRLELLIDKFGYPDKG